MFTLEEELRNPLGVSRRRVGAGALPAGPWLLRVVEGEREVAWPVGVFAKGLRVSVSGGEGPRPCPALCRHAAQSADEARAGAPRGARV